MNCIRFREILDESDLSGFPPEDRNDFLTHAESCPSCKAALDAHKQIGFVFASFLPSSHQVRDFNEKLLKRIASERNDSGQVLDKAGWFRQSWMSFAALAGALAIIAFIFQQSSPTDRNRIVNVETAATSAIGRIASKASLPATFEFNVSQLHEGAEGTQKPSLSFIAPGLQTETLSAQGEKAFIEGSEIITHNKSHTTLSFGKFARLSITGKGHLQIFHDRFEISSAEALFSFEKIPGEFEIRLPNVSLYIKGTSIEIKIENDANQVWVKEGNVAFLHRFSEISGTLLGNEGMNFATTGAKRIYESPLSACANPNAPLAPDVPAIQTNQVLDSQNPDVENLPASETATVEPVPIQNDPDAQDPNAGFLGEPSN